MGHFGSKNNMYLRICSPPPPKPNLIAEKLRGIYKKFSAKKLEKIMKKL